MGAREQNYEQTFEGGQEERKHRREVHPRLQEDHDGRNSYFQKAQRLHEMLQGYDSKRYAGTIDCVGMYRAVQFFVGTVGLALVVRTANFVSLRAVPSPRFLGWLTLLSCIGARRRAGYCWMSLIWPQPCLA